MLQLPQVSDCFKMKTNPLKDAKQLQLRVCYVLLGKEENCRVYFKWGISDLSHNNFSGHQWQTAEQTWDWTSDRDGCYSQHLSVTGREGPQTNYSERFRNHHIQQEYEKFWNVLEVQGIFLFCCCWGWIRINAYWETDRPSISKHLNSGCFVGSGPVSERTELGSQHHSHAPGCAPVDLRIWAGNHHFPWTS